MAVCRDIHGTYIDLKCVTTEDAEFTLDIRQDPEFEKYLPRINGTADQQIEWIKKQRQRNDDYFFVAWSKNGQRIGTVGVFDILNNPPKVGRLAMKGNAFQNIEAHLLVLLFSYYTLKLDNLWGFVFTENVRAIRFDLQFGVTMEEPAIYEDGRTIREVTFTLKNFEACLPKLISMLYRKHIPEDITYSNQLKRFV